MSYYSQFKETDFSDLLGKTITSIQGGTPGDDFIEFATSEGRTFKMHHFQGCCETVCVDDVTGDLADLLDSPILKAECATSGENPPGVEIDYQDSFTWTFYKLATIKGYVDIRWYGSSNGYYSEEVNFSEIVPETLE